jgi:hypothetical protein
MAIVVSETKGTPPTCPHFGHVPRFNAEACAKLPPEKRAAAYPPYQGRCHACGQQVCIYASQEHIRAIGWVQWAPSAPVLEDLSYE